MLDYHQTLIMFSSLFFFAPQVIKNNLEAIYAISQGTFKYL